LKKSDTSEGEIVDRDRLRNLKKLKKKRSKHRTKRIKKKRKNKYRDSSRAKKKRKNKIKKKKKVKKNKDKEKTRGEKSSADNKDNTDPSENDCNYIHGEETLCESWVNYIEEEAKVHALGRLITAFHIYRIGRGPEILAKGLEISRGRIR
jgi:hypothetical protein